MELRKWFGHDPKRWATFKARYRVRAEDVGALSRARALRALEREQRVVMLLFTARDETHNHAAALLEALNRRPPSVGYGRFRQKAGRRAGAWYAGEVRRRHEGSTLCPEASLDRRWRK
jgi:hypothetical protein